MSREKETKKAKDLEQVLVVPNEPSIHFSNPGEDYLFLTSFNEAWAAEVMEKASFVERWLAENDNKILQIIPYVVCVNSDNEILAYYRKGGGEGRLEGKKSIGIGGHVNIDDMISDDKTWDVVLNGAAREVSEELNADPRYVKENIKFAGIIYTPNDGSIDGKPTSTPRVGEVHLGALYFLRIPETVSLQPDQGMINPHFIDLYPDDLANYELWSLLTLSSIDEVLEKIK